eukprot:GHVO01068581.1.p1 GENE.GHVO01068581.1~~GHVO01068581.1.p1  ORF type:complete len:120 (+),score=23.01 GHVO01068581.1:25-384(+)
MHILEDVDVLVPQSPLWYTQCMIDAKVIDGDPVLAFAGKSVVQLLDARTRKIIGVCHDRSANPKCVRLIPAWGGGGSPSSCPIAGREYASMNGPRGWGGAAAAMSGVWHGRVKRIRNNM